MYNNLNFRKEMGKKPMHEASGAPQGQSSGTKMGQYQDSAFIEDCPSEIIYNSSEKESSRPSENVAAKSQKIKKERKIRVYNPDNTFKTGHVKRYYLFPFYYATLYPYFKISWKAWKPNSVYKKMAEFLSSIPGLPTKTSIQCKSYDQRMKEVNYVSLPEAKKVDLLEAAYSELSRFDLTEEDLKIIRNYEQAMAKKSSYIDFLASAMSSDEDEPVYDEIKNDTQNLISEEKKDQSSIETHNNYADLIFNQFLDVGK